MRRTVPDTVPWLCKQVITTAYPAFLLSGEQFV
jgi:hypothetical protein